MLNNKRVREKIPEVLVPLMTPHFEKLDEVLSPGLTLLRWTSLNLAHYASSVEAALDTLELLADRVTDLLTIQIEGVLKEISSTIICELPDNDPWTVDEFVSRNKVRATIINVTRTP